jgi:hypothetical protein
VIGLIGDTPPTAPRPSVQMVRIEEAPLINGVLDEAVWARAALIHDLKQVEPVEGAPPSERTEVRLLFDAEHLYIGVRCFDSEPDKIIATQSARDALLDYDDRIEIILDTYLDRRNAYFFQMSPAGSKGDALISSNGADFNKPWDGIWEGKAVIDELGWCMEVALPFATLGFDPDQDAFGFNLNRYIKRKGELVRWASPRNDTPIFLISAAGDLRGLTGLQQGLGIDVVPYFHIDWTNARLEGDEDLIGRPGLDAYWRITPSLQAILTVGTDFAETEVDERQINLTRFPLFFPEKRDFFLQDAGIFRFADTSPALIPFFSRRIGLSGDGDEVPILFGTKLAGRHDDWNIGLLQVRTEETNSQEAKDLYVARISRNIGSESTLGGIFTHGNPDGPENNQVYGLDWNFRTSQWRTNQSLRSSVWLLRSETEGGSGDDLAGGASLEGPNDLWRWRASAREVQENFRPALGFAPRTGVRNYLARVAYQPRPGNAVRQYEFSAEGEVYTDLDGELETARVELQPFGAEFESEDALRFEVEGLRDVLADDFEIKDGIVIPASSYDYGRVRLELNTSLRRPVSAELTLEGGTFYDGTREDVALDVGWRPSRLFNTSLGYQISRVDLEDGSFTTHIGTWRSNIAFTPDIDWNNFVQFDNQSDTLGWNSRLRWILSPGRDLYIVWNQSVERQGDSIVPLFQEAALKLGWTLRF